MFKFEGSKGRRFWDVCSSVAAAAGCGSDERRRRRWIRRWRRGEGHLSPRHVRRRDVLDRHAAHERGHPGGRRSHDRARRRPEGRRRGACRPSGRGHSERHRSASTSPATTIALLKLNAVVGVKGTVETVDGADTLTRVGITCALCHSTVDDSFAQGHRQAARRLAEPRPEPGRDHRAVARARRAEQKAVYNSWGTGKYDPRYNQDGMNGPQVIPPAYGLLGVNSITATGDGDRHRVLEPLRRRSRRWAGTARSRSRAPASTSPNGTDDQVSSKLPALQEYQLSIAAPAPPAGSFDAAAAGARQDGVRGGGQVRDLPQRRQLHRREQQAARAERGRQRAGAERRAQLRVAHRDQAVPDRAAEGRLAAPAVLPQRQRRRRWTPSSTPTTRASRWA